MNKDLENAIYLRVMQGTKAEQGDPIYLGAAAAYLHSTFIAVENGDDESLYKMEALDSSVRGNMLAKTLQAIHKTLKSPIDAADKIEHIQAMFDADNLSAIEAMLSDDS